MWSLFSNRLRNAPRLRYSDILWTVLPALLWLGLEQARPYVIKTHCATNPASCTAHSITLRIDRFALGQDSGKADEYSYLTQNISGGLAVLIPLGWHLGQVAIAGISPATALAELGTDIVLVLQTTFWNGTLTEGSHLISQRPRPFVYSDLAQFGPDPQNYTSFYSGHTSFAAAACGILFLILLGRRASRSVLWPTAMVGAVLIVLTGTFRVLAGRHFPTDVLAATLGGLGVALAVSWSHHTKTRM